MWTKSMQSSFRILGTYGSDTRSSSTHPVQLECRSPSYIQIEAWCWLRECIVCSKTSRSRTGFYYFLCKLPSVGYCFKLTKLATILQEFRLLYLVYPMAKFCLSHPSPCRWHHLQYSEPGKPCLQWAIQLIVFTALLLLLKICTNILRKMAKILALWHP